MWTFSCGRSLNCYEFWYVVENCEIVPIEPGNVFKMAQKRVFQGFSKILPFILSLFGLKLKSVFVANDRSKFYTCKYSCSGDISQSMLSANQIARARPTQPYLKSAKIKDKLVSQSFFILSIC